MTREELIEEFQESEASLRLEGFDLTNDGLYQSLKAKVIDGEMTFDQARTAFIDGFDAYYQSEAA